ncbi:hypothetical protein TNCV_1956001 [Trichonephila clavipes]|nr:hypothetical protein TNCV_1956001 [Trichonephila clavipes]
MQGNSVPDRQTFRVCRRYRDDSKSHRNARSQMLSLRAMVQRSKEKVQKQQQMAPQPMMARAYCGRPSIRDHWALRCIIRCPDQLVRLKRDPWYFNPTGDRTRTCGVEAR